MFKLADGWTKDKVREMVKAGNNGKKSTLMNSELPFVEFCAYENSDNNHCFIGCFIPKGHEGLKCDKDVKTLLSIYPELIKYMPFSDLHVLKMFQRAHDALTHVSSAYGALETFLDQQVE